MQNKVKTPVIWFSFYMALMLFQTSNMRLGTLTGFLTLAFSIITSFISGTVSVRKFVLPFENKCLFLFLIITLLWSLVMGGLPSYCMKFCAQILMCLVLTNITITEKEERYLRSIFLGSMMIYSLLIIHSCYVQGTIRYYHARITILGTSLDPNFVGIPIVAVSALILNNIIMYRRKWLYIIYYVISITAIIYTSSRGNLIGFLISNLFVLYFFLKKRNVENIYKALYKPLVILFVLAFMYCVYRYASIYFPEQWIRMISLNISDGADNGRVELWKRAWTAWKISPILGNGLGGMYREFGKATHNTYLQVISETGIIGTFLFLMFVIVRIIKAHRLKNKIYFCILTGMLIQMAFLDALDNRCVWSIFCWVTLIGNIINYEDLIDDDIENVNIQLYSKL